MKGFEHLLEGLGEYQQLRAAVEQGRLPAQVVGLSPVHKAHFIYTLCAQLGEKALVLTPDEASATRLCEDLNTLFDEEVCCLFPARDLVLRELEGASMEYEHARLGVLGRLLGGDCRVVVASAQAAGQYTIPPRELADTTRELDLSGSYELEELIAYFVSAGYVRVEQVEGRCQFSVRGGIVDIFPPHLPDPVRIEFWGEEVDSMATFSVESQRRIDSLKRVRITPAREALCLDLPDFIARLQKAAAALRGKYAPPAREQVRRDIEKLESGLMLTNMDKYLPMLYPKNSTLFAYCEGFLTFFCEAVTARERFRDASWQLQEDIKALLEEGGLLRGCDSFGADFTELCRLAAGRKTVLLDAFSRSTGDIAPRELIEVTAAGLSVWSGEYGLLREDLEDYRKRQYGILVLAGTERAAAALTEDLNRDGFPAERVEELGPLQPGQVLVGTGSLSAGLEYPTAKVALLSQSRGGPVRRPRRPRDKRGERIRDLSDLTVGDLVVHVSHGIGIFEGIIKREIQGVIKDYIKIRYAGTDTLFVPVNQLDLVSKYIGGREEAHVKLSRLNSTEWQKTRQRVKGAVADMAKELIKLYSQRMNAKGFAFSPDTDWQNDFEQRFPYEETDDQLRCVREIKEDMQSPRPMDRLLCGDVGFGKTEVALRAAFKCVMDSKQCAVLVPTTILAWQHYNTARARFEGFPIKVELLSRFRTPKQQAQILKELKRGEIDVVVGTHRLVQKDVEFKDLGLCIIDEEQRFGVAHKERFKELRNSLDVLTLSATPIPRTLNMAMSGIRDMSVIEEAPMDRHPVQTYVVEHDWGIIAEALRRELRRGGQAFYLHNRIDSLHSCASHLQELLPDARIAVAHGRMGEEELSGIWQQLLEREIDILICTTIIESGVDVANCNTLIIEDADNMGLAQLYQLRGRVGRSNRRAFAYLTFRRGKALSDVAEKRLSAIREFTTFGSGLGIAMRDLEIRGAGNILGAQQHGNMEAVGYDMYLQLLSEAVAQERGEAPSEQRARECLVDLRLEAHIPEDYIQNLSQRLDIYKKIAAIYSQEDAEDVLDELIDRFGEPPASVRGLVEVSLVRNTAAGLGIAEISQQGQSLLFYPERVDMEKVSRLAGRYRGRVLLSAGARPYISFKLQPGDKPLDIIRLALEGMSEQSA